MKYSAEQNVHQINSSFGFSFNAAPKSSVVTHAHLTQLSGGGLQSAPPYRTTDIFNRPCHTAPLLAERPIIVCGLLSALGWGTNRPQKRNTTVEKEADKQGIFRKVTPMTELKCATNHLSIIKTGVSNM